MRWLVFLLLLLPLQSVAQVKSYERLGAFERRDVDRVLKQLKLQVVGPELKRIAVIHIVNLEVFSEDAGLRGQKRRDPDALRHSLHRGEGQQGEEFPDAYGTIDGTTSSMAGSAPKPGGVRDQ